MITLVHHWISLDITGLLPGRDESGNGSKSLWTCWPWPIEAQRHCHGCFVNVCEKLKIAQVFKSWSWVWAFHGILERYVNCKDHMYSYVAFLYAFLQESRIILDFTKEEIAMVSRSFPNQDRQPSKNEKDARPKSPKDEKVWHRVTPVSSVSILRACVFHIGWLFVHCGYWWSWYS